MTIYLQVLYFRLCHNKSNCCHQMAMFIKFEGHYLPPIIFVELFINVKQRIFEGLN